MYAIRSYYENNYKNLSKLLWNYRNGCILFKTSNIKTGIMKRFILITGIVLIGAIMIAFTESKIIRGKVTDMNAQPLAGVVVTVKSYNFV